MKRGGNNVLRKGRGKVVPPALEFKELKALYINYL